MNILIKFPVNYLCNWKSTEPTGTTYICIYIGCSYLAYPIVAPSIESQLVVQALRLNTLSKLTFTDSKRFDSLVQDVFTGVPFKDLQYLELEGALREACQEANLVIIESQVSCMFGTCA